MERQFRHYVLIKRSCKCSKYWQVEHSIYWICMYMSYFTRQRISKRILCCARDIRFSLRGDYVSWFPLYKKSWYIAVYSVYYLRLWMDAVLVSGLVIQHLNDCSRHSTLLKHYKYSWLRKKKHCIASRAVALDPAHAVGVFYVTTLIAYKICLSCMSK